MDSIRLKKYDKLTWISVINMINYGRKERLSKCMMVYCFLL